MIDQHSAKTARKEIAMIKALVPMLHTTVLDRAMQAFGAMGISPDTPLADHWTWGRALRYADGPDEVHHRAVARLEIKDSTECPSILDAYLTPFEPD
jgi:acyl-CoA dehydrogenase